MTDDEWTDLLAAIREGNCTPFLGAGASTGLPTGSELAQMLADRFKLLIITENNLPRTAQYVSLLNNAGFEAVCRFVRNECAKRGTPDFSIETQIHRVLADLPLPIYVTTNYDDFMCLALDKVRKRPIRELCQWYSIGLSGKPPRSRAAEASLERPLVFHLHGSFEDLSSMVLTEDDYLDFLTVTSGTKWLMPPRVEKAFADTRLLFLGYSLEDMTFKVLLRRIATVIRRIERSHLTVQLRPVSEKDGPVGQQRIAIREAYVRRLLGNRAKVYWGSCDEFAAELAARWRQA